MKKKILAALATASVAVSSIAASVSAATLGDSPSVKPSDVSNITSNGKVPTTGDASTTLLQTATGNIGIRFPPFHLFYKPP